MLYVWDVKTIEDNALMNAWGFRMQAADYQGQAAASSAMASGISPLAEGASSLLTSAGSVAKAWYQYSQNKPIKDDYTSQNLGRVVGMGQAFGNAGLSAFSPKDPYQSFRHKGR